MRLGDLDALKNKIEGVVENEMPIDKKWALGLRYALKLIDNAPTVETKTIAECIIAYGDGYETARRLSERPQGEWLEYKEDNEIRYYCSNCHVTKGQAVNNFCACCGADMRGKEE